MNTHLNPILPSMISRSAFTGVLLALGILSPLGSLPVCADEYWDQRVSLFESLPVYSKDIVFLGNSITDGGEFAEIFRNPYIKNRGIRSDVINGVRKRLRQITSGHPAKIFLLIGINDVSHHLGAARIAENYRELVREIRAQSPETTLYIQSVMPVNNSFQRYKNLIGREKDIIQLNRELETIAQQEGAVYIDLTSALSDNNGNLRKEFTNDGLHLTGKGYKAWSAVLEPYIGPAPADTEGVDYEKTR